MCSRHRPEVILCTMPGAALLGSAKIGVGLREASLQGTDPAEDRPKVSRFLWRPSVILSARSGPPSLRRGCYAKTVAECKRGVSA